MEEYLLYICIATLCVFVLTILWFLQQTNSNVGPSQADRETESTEHVEDRLIRPQRAGGTARARMRVAQVQRQQERRDISDESADEEQAIAESDIPSGKVGKKKLAKLQLKAEKRAQREVDEREREERKAEEEKQWELRKIKDEQEREEEKLKADEERRIKEEEARKEQEEFEEFKQQFYIQAEGYDNIQDKKQEEIIMIQLLESIKKSKVVELDVLGSMFGMRTQNVINRVTDLQFDGRLTGVIDERGKFIYISREELEKVAKFIKQRGRVSLAEIAEASNELINLNPEIASEV